MGLKVCSKYMFPAIPLYCARTDILHALQPTACETVRMNKLLFDCILHSKTFWQ